MLINLFKFIQLLSSRTGVWAQECVSRGPALPSEDKDNSTGGERTAWGPRKRKLGTTGSFWQLSKILIREFNDSMAAWTKLQNQHINVQNPRPHSDFQKKFHWISHNLMNPLNPDHPQPASPALGSGGFLDQNKGGHPPRPEAWCGSSTVAWGLCLFLALLLPS